MADLCFWKAPGLVASRPGLSRTTARNRAGLDLDQGPAATDPAVDAEMTPPSGQPRKHWGGARLAMLGATGLLVGCAGGTGVFDAAGPVGAQDVAILIDALLIMLAVAIPTILLAFYMAWRYRAGNDKALYLPRWSYSGRIEAITWSIPILVILFLGGVIWIGSHRLDPF